MSEDGFLVKLERMDPRIIYTIVFILCIPPIVSPLGFPIPIESEVQLAFDTLDAIPAGGVVLMGAEFTAASWTELGPSWIACIKHLIKKDVKFILMNYFYAESIVSFDSMIYPRIESMLEEYGYEWGVDWVNMGFLPGGESALAAFASDVRVLGEDRYGTPIDDLPIWEGIDDLTDFALCLQLDPGSHLPEYLRQFQETYGLDHITITYGVVKSAYIPYINTGQLKGMMAAIGGGAQIEQLVGEPSVASAGMDAVSTSHIFAAILLIVGNLLFWINRSKGGQ
jgi:hypothetical protein